MDTTPQTGNSEADELLAEVQAAITEGLAAGAAALDRHGHAVPARGGIARLANTLQDALKAVGYGNEKPADLGAAARAAFHLTNAHTASDTIPFGLSIGSDITERVARTRANLDAAYKALAEYQATQPQVDAAVDLDASYTTTYVGDDTPTTITPQVRTKVKNGVTITIVSNLAPLLAGKIDVIKDSATRRSTLLTLRNAVIAIRDTPDDTIPDGPMSGSYYRDRGTLGTTYYGTGDLPVSAVLDLAERLRAHLGP